MKVHKWTDVKKKKFSKHKIQEMDKRVDQELFEMDLRALRKMLSKTQEEVAEEADMTQSELSRLERRSDHKLSTLRRIVRSMGGELEISAKFGRKRIRLFSATSDENLQ